MSTGPLHGKTILITGAARGIGAHAARHLHAQGANVALVGLEPVALRALAAELGEHRAIAIEADVVDGPAMLRAAEQTRQKLGAIDVLIANAGILHLGTVVGGDAAGFDRTLAVNINGLLNSLRACAPQLVEQRGYILNVASMAALTHGPGMGAYAASKAAVDAISDSLRIELGLHDVAVGCAYFGAIETDLVRGSRMHPAMARLESLVPASVGRAVPVHRAGEAISRAILRRSRRVWVPGWTWAIYTLRGIAQPLLDRRLSHRSRVAVLREALRLADERQSQADGMLGTSANVTRAGSEPGTG